MRRLPDRMRTAYVSSQGMVKGRDRRGVCSAGMVPTHEYTPPVVL